jgi:SAM-dependent methyltransferase
VFSAVAQANRQVWDRASDDEQQRDVRAPAAETWGVWEVPETEICMLGSVEQLDVLEAGCGSARFSISLALRGAHATALDLSPRQLDHARRLADEATANVRFVEATVEAMPFADGSFDLVFADHGAFDYCDPRVSIPESARVLRHGGLLVFSAVTPLASCCWTDYGPMRELVRPYFGEPERTNAVGAVEFQLGYAEWIEIFVAAGLVIERLLELRPPSGLAEWPTSLLAWARLFPAEHIWRLRKAG